MLPRIRCPRLMLGERRLGGVTNSRETRTRGASRLPNQAAQISPAQSGRRRVCASMLRRLPLVLLVVAAAASALGLLIGLAVRGPALQPRGHREG